MDIRSFCVSAHCLREKHKCFFCIFFPVFGILLLWQNDGAHFPPQYFFAEKVTCMITNNDILNMNFYQKEIFTGSYEGMRYLIKKDTAADGEDTSAGSTPVFRATIWPGPYNFASTADDKKASADFPFTPEGKEQVVDWLNEQWRARKAEWPRRD